MSIGPIQLVREANSTQRRTLLAASLGWMLDSFDTMLYVMVLAHVMGEFGMSKKTAGLLNTLTLLASGIGGVAFGFLGDRIGRKRSLMLSIATYSMFSFASGLSPGIVSLAIFRFILGLGMGGEWNTGATLVAEAWPSELRAKAIALVQSSWAVGYALAALVSGVVLRYFNWRAVFFVGILPAIVTLWIQSRVPESELWEQQKSARLGRGMANESAPSRERPPGSGDSFLQIFRPPLLKSTMTLLLVNFFGMFAWWGLFSWIPPYLSLPVDQGGRGFSVINTTSLLIVLNLAGMLPGYISFGWVADHLGRRRSFMLYTFVAALLVPLYAVARSPAMLLVVGTAVAFFGTGFFSGSGIAGSELFPTGVRARALGFTYNGARAMSALAPFAIGWIGQLKGLSWAFYLCGGAFLLASLMATQLPETKGQDLT